MALTKSELKWAPPFDNEQPAQPGGSNDGGRKRERSHPPGGMTPRQPQAKKGKPTVGKTQQNTTQKTRYANIAKCGKPSCIGFNKGHCKGDQCQYGYVRPCVLRHRERAQAREEPPGHAPQPGALGTAPPDPRGRGATRRDLPTDTMVLDVARRLAAAKPASWRGRGELISPPWKAPIVGPVLLIDLWSGFSGAGILIMPSLGVKFYVLAAESNPDVVKMAETNIDQIVHVPSVELIDA